MYIQMYQAQNDQTRIAQLHQHQTDFTLLSTILKETLEVSKSNLQRAFSTGTFPHKEKVAPIQILNTNGINQCLNDIDKDDIQSLKDHSNPISLLDMSTTHHELKRRNSHIEDE